MMNNSNNNHMVWHPRLDSFSSGIVVTNLKWPVFTSSSNSPDQIFESACLLDCLVFQRTFY